MQGKKVLIVDDSNLIRLEMKKILEDLELVVMELNNAEDIFRLSWQFSDIDLLILDVVLPGIDGITALQQMRSDPFWSYLPVIMLTGQADALTVSRALKAGAIDFIIKPFTRDDVNKRVSRILYMPKINDIKKLLNNEVERAKRGKTKVSLLQLLIPPSMKQAPDFQEVINLRNLVNRNLRQIDSVLMTTTHDLLMYLPLSDADTAKFVEHKLRDELPETVSASCNFVSVTYPEEGETAQQLLTTLTQKLKQLECSLPVVDPHAAPPA